MSATAVGKAALGETGAAPDVALVTGAAHGLGARIAKALRFAGFKVGIGDIDGPAAEALALELSCWGSVEALINNAAVTAAKPVLEITPAEFDAVLAVNVCGTFLGSQTFGREFKSRGYGRIVNLASLAGHAFVAAMTARLCARDAGFVNGATWDINGGLFMR